MAIETASIPNNHFGELMTEIEAGIREGLATISRWNDRVISLIEENPDSLISSIAVAGFVAGILLRRTDERTPRGMDPLPLLGASVLAGFLIGPRLLEQLEPGRVRRFRGGPKPTTPESRH